MGLSFQKRVCIDFLTNQEKTEFGVYMSSPTATATFFAISWGQELSSEPGLALGSIPCDLQLIFLATMTSVQCEWQRTVQ